jgi:hypothetical protein
MSGSKPTSRTRAFVTIVPSVIVAAGAVGQFAASNFTPQAGDVAI